MRILAGATVTHTVCTSDGVPVTRYLCRVVAEDEVHILADYLMDNGVTVQRWIPVTERLPEDGQTVIACVTHRFGDKSIIPMVFWHESYFHWQDVTHWMPLPEPPKEGE